MSGSKHQKKNEKILQINSTKLSEILKHLRTLRQSRIFLEKYEIAYEELENIPKKRKFKGIGLCDSEKPWGKDKCKFRTDQKSYNFCPVCGGALYWK